MNTASVTAPSTNERWLRFVNAILGAWLFVSAFLWPHTAAQTTNAIVVGVLAVIFAGIAAFSRPNARFANTALGIWLFISAFALTTRSTPTPWNEIFVGILMIGCSLVPSSLGRTARTATS